MAFIVYDCVAVGVYSDYKDVETAVKLLERSHIKPEQISVVGHDKNIQEALEGRYTPPEYLEQGIQHTTERTGTLIGGLAGFLIGATTLFLPGIGLLAVLGPLAGLIGGAAVGGLQGDIAGHVTFDDVASEYREWLAAGNYLVYVNCTGFDEPEVRKVLERVSALSVISRPINTVAQ